MAQRHTHAVSGCAARAYVVLSVEWPTLRRGAPTGGRYGEGWAAQRRPGAQSPKAGAGGAPVAGVWVGPRGSADGAARGTRVDCHRVNDDDMDDDERKVSANCTCTARD